MSTNINTKTPETPLPQGSNGAQGAPTTNPVGFQSGNAANTTAILALIRAMMTLYEYKNDAFVKQSQTESTIANSYSDSQVELGNQEMTELEIQGAFSAVSGLFTAGLGFKGMMEEGGLAGQQKEITESQKFVDNLDNDPAVTLSDNTEENTTARGTEIEMQDMSNIEVTEEPTQEEIDANKAKAEARLEEMITELKSGNYKMTEGSGKSAKAADPAKIQKGELNDQQVIDTLDEPQMTRLKDAANEQIAAKQKTLDDAKAQLRMNFDKRNMWSTAVSGIFTGGGNIGAGILKQQQGEQQADNTQYQTAQQQFQSLSKETESQSDKDLQSAESLTQLIPEIDKSNNAILST
jgi:hypothetical protein